MKSVGTCLILVGALFAAVSCGSGAGSTVQAAGSRYVVSILVVDPIEVRVDSGEAQAVTLAAAMPGMGHAMPSVATVQVEAGRFVAVENVLTMDGEWELSINLSGDRGTEIITVGVPVRR
ncbi:hypothetical protein IU459_31170 [Nocardia amamiensis]|uniref:YtkA-like domain-containing protein n=1 Tax=Nocardia amamiensis TaxID=404578 RepID=A0ABS0CZF3_9NOCA|nr:hypothetical protein [Nocardia amamiensis]MBF6301975.1 hypothetical protein [Nocardia amamiensis]